MERDKTIIKVSLIGIIVNIILVVFKAIVGIIANSIAIILDAVNNLSDVLSSVITIIGTKLSGKKPDKEHPYGHGRIEYFSSVIIAVIILMAGLASLRESIIKIFERQKAVYSVYSIIIIIIAIFVKFFLGQFVKKKGEQLKSGNLIASGIDSMNDSIISISTLIAAIISIVWHISLEGYLGAIISIVILKSAVEILQDTINEMIGIRADPKLTKEIRDKVMSFEDVLGVYDLILHNYGPNTIIGTAHIQVRDDMNAKEIHRLTNRIIVQIYQEIGIVMTIGIYASNDSDEYKGIKDCLLKVIKEYKNIIQMHGFYVDEEYKNISFDLIFSFDEENPEQIVEEIKNKLKSQYSEYEYIIKIDTNFSD